MRRIVCCILLLNLFVSKNAISQIKSIYPQNYFRSPLDIPLDLSANFGDLRSNHFHMGLDIRTKGRENLNVYAAAEGYVSRIKIEKWGYGRAIYITHPNGYTTVYGHLNIFYKALEDHVKAKQYDDEKWEQDITFLPNEFPVTKGQFIALSGNTGGSAGPHLHFEIRDTKTENNINPELFGYHIPDNIAPTVYGLYWYDRRHSTYLSGPNSVPLKLSASNNYSSLQNVVQIGSPLLSLAVKTLDRRTNSSFKFGIYQAELWMDDSLINAFQLNNFSYPDSRYINACTDYPVYMKTNSFIQHLSILPGNLLSVFSDAGGSGNIILSDTAVHKIDILLKDVHDNSTGIHFLLQYKSSLQQNVSYSPNSYLLQPQHANSVIGKNVKAYFSTTAFYDTVPFQLAENIPLAPNGVSSFVALHNYTIPVHDSFTVKLKPISTFNFALKDKVVMQLISGGHKEVAKGEWQGDWLSAKFNRLGFVQLLVDKTAPVIKQIGWTNATKFSSQKTLRLHCTDELDEVEDFSATLDGQWLLFAKKNDDFIYTFDEYCKPGKHTLTVTVTDKAGNVSTKDFTVTKL